MWKMIPMLRMTLMSKTITRLGVPFLSFDLDLRCFAGEG